jgi:hypothetical protein
MCPCSQVRFLWNVISDAISALEPAIDLPAGPDIRDVKDLGIDREDNPIVPDSRGSAIYTDQGFREPRSLRFGCNRLQLFPYAGLGAAVE